MRTSVDLDDDLFRELKATAALRGISMRELITKAIVRELASGSAATVTAETEAPSTTPTSGERKHPAVGALAEYVDRPGISHDIDDIRASVAAARRRGDL